MEKSENESMSRKGWTMPKIIPEGEWSQVVGQDERLDWAGTVAWCEIWELDKWSVWAKRWAGLPLDVTGSEAGETLESIVDRIIEYVWRIEPKEDGSRVSSSEEGLRKQEPEPNGGRTTTE